MSSGIKFIGIGTFGESVLESLHLHGARKSESVLLTRSSKKPRFSSEFRALRVDCSPEALISAVTGERYLDEEVEEFRDQLSDALLDTQLMILVTDVRDTANIATSKFAAQVAAERNLLSVAVVMKPFHFEGLTKHQQTDQTVSDLLQHAAVVTALPSGDTLRPSSMATRMSDVFVACSSFVTALVMGLRDAADREAQTTIDFSAIQAIFSYEGASVASSGRSFGENNAETALLKALTHPSLQGIKISAAQGMLLHLLVGPNFSPDQLESIRLFLSGIRAQGTQTTLLGLTVDSSLGDSVTATVMLTGVISNSELKVSEGGTEAFPGMSYLIR